MKYKVWDKRHKTWSQNSHFYLTPNGDLYRAGKNLNKLKEVVFGSGVTDDNGNEIFAGHIIKIGNQSPPYLEVVELKDGQFQTHDECEWISKIACKELGPGCVIVGHIFEHDLTLEPEELSENALLF
jgi:hypothetical protein